MTSEPSVASYMTADEVGKMLQLSSKSVYRLAKDYPDMPALKLGGTLRFPRERLLRWLRDREQGRPRTRKPVPLAAKLAFQQEATVE